jgi:2,4-dienoyl-CoA reductase (NADPH2)
MLLTVTGTLFSPFELAGLKLKNRVVMAPMGTGLPDHEGHVNDETIAYYVRRAQGGVGMIVLEASLVVPGSSAIGPELRLHDPAFVPGLRRLADAVHAYGVPVGPQLWHPGRQTILGEPVAPSPVPLSRRSPVPHELTRAEIAKITRFYGRAAAYSKDAGFDFVEIHAAHCYLPCEFLSPSCNFREDEYGGELRNRARFLLEVVKSIQTECGPGFPIFCRVSGDEGTADGFGIDEAVEVCRWLEEAGVACLSVSAGSWHSLHLTIPPMSVERGCHVPLAARIKSEVGVPVVVAGRLDLSGDGQAVLDAGQADLIGIGRALIADPDWPNKMRDGHFDEIRPCIACNACVDLVARGAQAQCAVNAEVSRELTWQLTRAESPRRVMIVGGGPAGMEAARVARLRGHTVSLFEQADELGGKLDVASRAPSKSEVLRYRDYQVRTLEHLGVRIRVGEPVTAATITDEDPQVILFAAGAEPMVPPIPGIHGPNVVDAQDVLLDRVSITPGERIAVIGGSATGVETAEYLVGKAGEVTVIEMQPTLAAGVEGITRRLILSGLRDSGVTLLTESKLMLVEPMYVLYETTDGESHRLEVDRVALAIGWRPRGSVLTEVGDREVVVLGDASGAADFVAAVASGALAGLSI